MFLGAILYHFGLMLQEAMVESHWFFELFAKWRGRWLWTSTSPRVLRISGLHGCQMNLQKWCNFVLVTSAKLVGWPLFWRRKRWMRAKWWWWLAMLAVCFQMSWYVNAWSARWNLPSCHVVRERKAARAWWCWILRRTWTYRMGHWSILPDLALLKQTRDTKQPWNVLMKISHPKIASWLVFVRQLKILRDDSLTNNVFCRRWRESTDTLHGAQAKKKPHNLDVFIVLTR